MNMKFVRTWAMLALVMVIGLSVTGGTIAWFTDSVESTGNVIQSGNLDMVVEYWDSTANDWAELKEDTKLFKQGALYEPGYTEWVALRIANEGNLAFKWEARLNIEDTVIGKSVLDNDIALSDYLTVGTLNQVEKNFGISMWEATKDSTLKNRETTLNVVKTDSGLLNLKDKDTEGLLTIADSNSPMLPGDDSSEFVVIVLHMPDEVGNEANHKTGTPAPQINLGLHVVATQATYEADSFDSNYDAEATYPDGAQPSDLPKANVTPLAPEDMSKDFIKVTDWNNPFASVNNPRTPITLTVGYNFKATETAEQAAQSPYRYYNADFVVTASKAIPTGVIGLAGEYNVPGFGVAPVAFDLDAALLALIDENATEYEAGKGFRLLKDIVPTNYEEVCTNVREFMCGVYFCDGVTDAQKEALKGTTLTVQLRLYETIPPVPNDEGELRPSPIEVEGGKNFTIATYTYTF